VLTPSHRPHATSRAAGTRDARSADERTSRLDAAMARLLSRRRITHAVAGVSTLDGSFRWRGAGGEARPDGTPMRPETPFFVASVTKLFIATTVLQLVEEGRFTLATPMVELLPAWATPRLHVLDGVDHTPAITVRHLLGHTSGLPDFLEDRPRGERSWYRELVDGIDRSWTFEDVVRRSRDELTPRFAPQDLTAARQRARYSDTGYQLLVRIVEETTGAAFGDELTRRLLRPLGLRQTSLPGRTEPLDPTPAAALIYDRGAPLDVPGSLVACNDLLSTVGDLERFVTAWAGGEVFAEPATSVAIHERYNRIGYPLRYGLGVMRFPIARIAGPGRRPATLVGHSGATGSWAFHCPELDLVLTGTVDQIRGRSIPFRFMAALLRAYHG
jgi:D-alanyl-D-alanine carboxypeptidase